MASVETENKELKKLLPLLPLKNVVILPKSIIPIIVGRESSIQAVEAALKKDKSIFISAQKDSSVEQPSVEDVYQYGTKSTILQVMRTPNGALKILAEGISRAKITDSVVTDEGFISVACQDLPTVAPKEGVELQALWRQLQTLYKEYAKLNDSAPTELITTAKTVEDQDYITDTIAVHINLSLTERQAILELPNLKRRMLKLCEHLMKEIEILQTEQRIRGRIQNQVEKSQREYYLTEQMKAIQKELGREDQAGEIEAMRSAIKTLQLPKEALEKSDKELRRLEQMPPMSSEAVVSRNYLDWIISLPWHKETKDTIELRQAENILNNTHAGLKKAKERIIEFIAAKKFSKSLERSPVLCLVGPPGVGKTSLAQVIALSLGRKFVRISLGGVRDEAEIRGHRRTYIGALPGKILQAMKKARTINPVILLDEIDKMSRDIHGDPAAALLEVLDPEQNKNFVDHFLDLGYDISKVMFIATANVADNIPYALYDRLEIITLSGYTEEEKVQIATKFLIPRNLQEYGLKKRQFKLPEPLLKKIINEYTKEAGVRQLERILAKLMRKVIQEILRDDTIKSVTITPENLQRWLSYPPFKRTSLNTRQDRIGLVTGLAWTEVGGDVLEIETSIVAGKGGLTLTGQLGDVMQESAHAALSYIRSRTQELNLKQSFYSSKDIHLHIPEGATPKDGPSAGIGICTAIVSALTKNPTKNALAMTGEITLQGRVLAIGGLKEKLLAAIQHGMTAVIIPYENYDDVQEIVRDADLGALNIIYVKTMDVVLQAALTQDPFLKPVKKTRAPRKKTGKTSKKR